MKENNKISVSDLVMVAFPVKMQDKDQQGRRYISVHAVRCGVKGGQAVHVFDG